MRLKVCGVRSMEMLQACQDLSVPVIGFNFVPASKRRIELSLAQKLSQAYTGTKVGVFQNHSPAEIELVTQVVDLDVIQLHGEEDSAFIRTLKDRLSNQPSLRYWKALKVNETLEANQLQEYSKNVDLILFDGANPGSGTLIEHSAHLNHLSRACQAEGLKFGVAGGVNHHSANDLLAKFPEAFLFDTASGVETNGEFSRAELIKLLNTLKDV